MSDNSESTAADAAPEPTQVFDDVFGTNFSGSLENDSPKSPEPAPEPEPAKESASGEPKPPETTDIPAQSEGEDSAGQVKMVPHGAMHAEREKRKEAEAKNSEFSQRFDRLEQAFARFLEAQTPQQAPAADPLEGVDFLDDPGKARDAVTKAIESKTAALQSDFDNRMQRIGEANAKAKYEDFDAVASDFVARAQRDPQLLQAYHGTPPEMRAEFVYTQAKNAAFLEAAGTSDLQTLLDQAEQRGREAALAQQKAEHEQLTGQKGKTETPKKSLSDLPGAGGAKADTGSGVTPDNFGNQFRGNFV